MGVEKRIVADRKNTRELVCNNCGEIFIYRCKNSKAPSYCSYCYRDMKRAHEQQLEEEKQRIEDEKWRRQSMIDKERFEEQLRHISTINFFIMF